MNHFVNMTKCEDKDILSDSDDFLTEKKEHVVLKKRSKSSETVKFNYKIRSSVIKAPKLNLKLSNETPKFNFVSSKILANHIRNPLLLIIDVRASGMINGSTEQTYNSKHIRLSINVPIEDKTQEEALEDIESDQFLRPMLIFSIQMQYKIVIYDQNCEGENSPAFQFYSIVESFALKNGSDTFGKNLYLLRGGFAEFEKSFNHLCGNTKDLRSPLNNNNNNNNNINLFEENIIDQIHPRIYLGRQLSSDEIEILRENNIQHVLSISNAQDQLPDDIKLLFIPLEDSLESNLLDILELTFNFIEGALKYNNNSGKIFIHCSRGLSRSPTILIAYLMRKLNLSTKESFEMVKRSRPTIGPQCNFIRQLLLLEKELSGDLHFVPSLPLQIYVLHETRCEDYYRSVEFIEEKKKEKSFFLYTSAISFLKRKKNCLADR